MLTPTLALWLCAAAEALPPPPIPALPAKAGTPSLGVFEIEITGAPSESLDAAALGEVFSKSLDDPTLYSLTSAKDLASLLTYERQRQLLGNAEEGGGSSLSGALGADLIAAASVGELRGRYVAAGRIIEVASSKVVARAAVTVDDIPELTEAMHRLAYELRATYRSERGLPVDPTLELEARSSVGLYLGAVSDPLHRRVGGEVAVAFRFAQAWYLNAGATIAPNPGGRLAVARRLFLTEGGRFSMALGPRLMVTPWGGGVMLGGGAGVTARLRLAKHLDAVAGGAGEVHLVAGAPLFAPIVTAGVQGNL